MNPLPLLARNPVHSVAEQNQRLPKAKPFCRGYMPDVPSPFVQNWAFAAHKVDLVNGAKKKKKPRQVESRVCIRIVVKVRIIRIPTILSTFRNPVSGNFKTG